MKEDNNKELFEFRIDRAMSERFKVLQENQSRDHKETLASIDAMKKEINTKFDPMYKAYEGLNLLRKWFLAIIGFLLIMATFFSTFRNFIIAALTHLK